MQSHVLKQEGLERLPIDSKPELLSLNFEAAKEFERSLNHLRATKNDLILFWAERISFSGVEPRIIPNFWIDPKLGKL